MACSLLRQTNPNDEKPLIDFLVRTFAADPTAGFVGPSLLRWKYWSVREDYQEARSYVVERNGHIVAHAGLWPVTLRSGERGVHMIDWAADPSAPGAGVSLLQHLTKKFDFVYSIGGSRMTQTVLPRFGFRQIAEALTWARPIRPWKQILQHQRRDLRLPLRFVRNLWWSKRPRRLIDHEWTAEQADAADGVRFFGSERDESFFRYLEQCPVGRYQAFQIAKGGRKVGFIAHFSVRAQTRVAGLWLENPSAENWRAALYLSQETALKYTDTSELVASCATQTSANAARQVGMRIRARRPVFLLGKVDGTERLPLHFQMADNDSIFLAGQHPDFLT